MAKASLSNQMTQEASKQMPPKTSKVTGHIKERGRDFGERCLFMKSRYGYIYALLRGM